MTLNKEIGNKIRAIRDNKGMSQFDLGKAVGIKEEQAQQYIYKYEKGIITIPADILTKIAEVLDVPVAKFYPSNVSPADISSQTVPLISWIRAGRMHYPIDNLQPGESDGPPIPSTCKDQDCFALRVQGDSMMPEFQEGEIIVVSPNTEAHTGDYVVAKYDGDVTFKKLKIYPDAIILRPLNEKYEEVVIKGKALKDFKVIGKVVERIKRY